MLTAGSRPGVGRRKRVGPQGFPHSTCPAGAGSPLFSCNGRGTRLFPEPHHDARGFFAQGELGPVGGQNFIHGFTASLALFEE
jgi:small ligand-binding sensory domain FIST